MSRPTEGMSQPEPTTARAEVPGTLISDYVLRQVPKPRELILILHGFTLSGKFMYDKLVSICPEDSVILAPNAPFPLPERKPDGGYRVGFSWYFYNAAKDEYFIDMKIAIELLTGLVRQLGLEHLPVRIIGFSQGGYLAGLAALHLQNVRQVVGVAASHLPDEIEEAARAQGRGFPLRIRFDSVHGSKDDVVSVDGAKKAHGQLLVRGAQGRFIELPEEGHRLTRAMQASIGELLEDGGSQGEPGRRVLGGAF